MSGFLNRVTLIGNLGADPELRTTQAGRRIVSMSIATSESWKDDRGERKQRTEWHRVIIFNEGLDKVAEQYLVKRAKVLIEGQLRTRQWQDQQGNDRYSTEIVLSQYIGFLTMLDSKQNGTAVANEAGSDRAPPPTPAGDLDDDIPF